MQKHVLQTLIIKVAEKQDFDPSALGNAARGTFFEKQYNAIHNEAAPVIEERRRETIKRKTMLNNYLQAS